MLGTGKDYCPYCGESIELVLDESMVGETYIEDCQVCCRPISVEITLSEEVEESCFNPDQFDRDGAVNAEEPESRGAMTLVLKREDDT